jgi:hypothetical protein
MKPQVTQPEGKRPQTIGDQNQKISQLPDFTFITTIFIYNTFVAIEKSVDLNPIISTSLLSPKNTRFKYTITNSKMVSESKKAYFSLAIFILVLTVGVTFSSFSNATFFGFKYIAFITTAYAQSDPSPLSSEELRQQAKDFLSTLMELRNQSGMNASSLIDESADNASADDASLASQQFATDVSGHYSNPSFGIVDFVIPSGWRGSEKQWSGDKSISLDMQQGTETEYMDRLLSPSVDDNDENDPTMTLESNDKAELQYTQSLLGKSPAVAEAAPADQCKSLDGSIRFLEPNSTATIDSKTFNVFTMECRWKTDFGEMQTGNLNDMMSGSTGGGSSIEVSKTYRYESPERIYSLQLKVSKDLYTDGQGVSQNVIDIKKYTPIIDAAVQTLKIE